MALFSKSSIHRPLAGSEIRLVHVKAGELDQPIVCELEHVSLDTSPSYIALSYVWGDVKDPKPITLNGHLLNVTGNLFTALQQLREWQKTEEPLFQNVRLDSQPGIWIDALCINQTDVKEKSEQVPLMGKIYSSAKHVVAWLGPNEPSEDAIIHEVFEKANQLDILYNQPEIGLAAIPTFVSYLSDENGTSDITIFCDAIVNVIRRPWFTRVWVVQEAILAREPAILLAGKVTTTVHNLYFLWAALRMYVKDGTIRQGLVAGIRIGHFESTRLKVQSEEWRVPSGQADLATFAKQLYELLDRAAGHLRSTLPQDMIYGLLGMADIPRLPDELRPNYEKPWWEVFRDFSRFLIENTGNLALMPTTRKDIFEAPSWVPDFREQRFGTTGLKSDPPTVASTVFSLDGNCMTVEGVELSTCVSSFQANPACMDDIVLLIEALPRFEKVILNQAYRINDSSLNETLKKWLGFLIESSHYNAFDSVIDDFYEIYCLLIGRDCSDKDEAIDKGKSKMSDDGTSGNISLTDRLALAHLLQESLGGLSHFVTTDGTIGMLMRQDARAQQGDRLCVFKGSIYSSLVRPWKEDYIFMGGCRLNDGSNDETYKKEFFDGNILRKFTLI